MVIKNDITRMAVKENLSTVHKSCEEGLTGEWDCSTDEGKKGFQDMISLIEIIAKDLEIEIE